MIAITIPYYKISYFEATLQSLANQTDKRFKVYIGDDASPDDCSFLLDHYKAHLCLKYQRFETNIGGSSLTMQWQRCIALSGEEEWVMILGDDDVLENNCIALFYKHLEIVENEKFNLVRFASAYTNRLGERISEIYHHPKVERVTDSYFRHFTGDSRSSLSEYVFRRTVYEEKRFTDLPLAWHSDDKAWLDFTNCGYVYTINEAVVDVRISESSISGKSDNIALKEKARLSFIEDVVTKKLSFFNKLQKITFLLEYGVLLKKTEKLSFKKGYYIGCQLLKTGAFIPFLKFVRRFYKAKYKSN